MTKLNNVFLGFVLMIFPAMSAAEDYAGTVKTLRGSALAERAGTRVPLDVGTRVNEGDRIFADMNGYVGIALRDDTLLTLGPGTMLILNTYGFDPKTHEGSALVSLTKGVLYVVTGLLAKRTRSSFQMKTTTATIGIRGTEFIVEAEDL